MSCCSITSTSVHSCTRSFANGVATVCVSLWNIVYRFFSSIAQFFSNLRSHEINQDDTQGRELSEISLNPEQNFANLKEILLPSNLHRDSDQASTLKFLADAFQKIEDDLQDVNKIQNNVGIYRVSSSSQKLDKFYSNFCQGDSFEKIIEDCEREIPSDERNIFLANLIKRIIIRLEIIPIETFQEKFTNIDFNDRDNVVLRINDLIAELDSNKKSLFEKILRHLNKIASVEELLMREINLGVIFGPSLINHSAELSQEKYDHFLSHCTPFAENCIRYFDNLKWNG